MLHRELCDHTSSGNNNRLFCGKTARFSWLTSRHMPKKGIHPVLRTVTYVLKNGASVELPTVQQRSVPYTLQADTTTNPLWTGDKKIVSSAGRSAKMMRRYEKMGFKFAGDADEEPSIKQPAQQTGQP